MKAESISSWGYDAGIHYGEFIEQDMVPFPGFFLYYPSRWQQPAALSAVIETLRLEENRRQ